MNKKGQLFGYIIVGIAILTILMLTYVTIRIELTDYNSDVNGTPEEPKYQINEPTYHGDPVFSPNQQNIMLYEQNEVYL